MSVHKDEKTNTWYFKKRVKNLNGGITNTTKRGFKTKKEAQKAEALYEINIDEFSNVSFNELCDNYLNYLKSKIKYSTIYSKRIIINKYMREYFNNIKPCNISNLDILNWHEELKRTGLKVKRINKINGELKAIFEYGEKFYKLTNNPARVVGSIKDNSAKKIVMKVWSPDEFNMFISKCDNKVYYTLFNLLYYTGMRKGEALALTWEDLNIDNKQIRISKTMSQKHDDKSNRPYLITTPKSSSGNRIVDLPTNLVNILLDHKQYMSNLYKDVSSSSLIFGYDKPLSETSINRYKNKICKLANVEQIRIHDLRHSHASLLIGMGINPIFISERLGHKNVSTTLDTYSHLFPTNQQEIVKRLDTLMNENLEKCSQNVLK